MPEIRKYEPTIILRKFENININNSTIRFMIAIINVPDTIIS